VIETKTRKYPLSSVDAVLERPEENGGYMLHFCHERRDLLSVDVLEITRNNKGTFLIEE